MSRRNVDGIRWQYSFPKDTKRVPCSCRHPTKKTEIVSDK